MGRCETLLDGILLLERSAESLPSLLGRTYHNGIPVVALSDTTSSLSRRDIFPLNLDSVGAWVSSRLAEHDVYSLFLPDECPTASIISLVRTLGAGLNFLACVGWEEKCIRDRPANKITGAQNSVLEHLLQSSIQFITWETPDSRGPNLSELRKEISSLRVDYSGAVIQKARELTCAQVIAVWPPKEKAASVPITRFLKGELLDDVLDPRRCLKPESEWPARPKTAKVHATPSEWYDIGKAGLERGIFGICQQEDVFRDRAGIPIVNGAMGVTKIKQTAEGPVDCLRFM